MLRRVRFSLTALYSLFGLLLILAMGLGSFLLLRQYFAASNDAAIKWAIAQQFKLAGAKLPTELSGADKSWLAPVKSVKDHDDHEDESHVNPALAAVFLFPVRADGVIASGQPTAPAFIDREAIAAAITNGSDSRTSVSASGERIRIVTFPISGPNGQVAIQAGRYLGDQDMLLTSLTFGLAGIGLVSAIFLASASWWLSGRSIQPAERAWANQQTFVANAGHELRTPLTFIRATAEVAKRGSDDADTRALLDDVLAECDYMSRLTGDLLLLSRIDAGKLELNLGPVSLAGLLADVQRGSDRIAADRGITLAFDPTPLTAIGDATRVRQVLLILLDNAFRHTPAGGSIQIAASQREGRIVISVQDSGEGIPAEFQGRVFDRFFRVDSARGAGGGTGLGLSVARSLVEAQGGSIMLESAQGRGTTVSFSLPSSGGGQTESASRPVHETADAAPGS